MADSCGIASRASSSVQYSLTSTWSGSVGRAPDGSHAIDVESVATPQLQLEAPEATPGARLLGTPSHVVRVAEPDRERRRRALATEAQHAPERLTAELAAEIVQRRVDGRLRRHLAGHLRETGFDLLECERILAEQLAGTVEEARRRRDALAVVILGSRLAETRDATRRELDPDDLDLDVGRSRDPER